jgi:hypothetical protein
MATPAPIHPHVGLIIGLVVDFCKQGFRNHFMKLANGGNRPRHSIVRGRFEPLERGCVDNVDMTFPVAAK